VHDEIDFPADHVPRADQHARVTLMQVTAQRDLELFSRFLGRDEAEPAEWREAVTVHTRTAVMGADQLREWGRAIEAITREHIERARRQPAEGHRPVRLAIRGFPQEFGSAASG
jgi:hypothetical protein